MTPTDKEKLDKKSAKNTEDLVKEVKILSGRFKALGDKPDMNQKGMKGALAGNVMGYAKERFGIPTSASGALEALSQRAGGGIMSTVLSTASEALRSKAEEKEKKASWVHAMGAGTEEGRKTIEEHGLAKATKIFSEKYEAKKRLESEISGIEDQRKMLQGAGVEGADLSKEDRKRLDSKKKQLAGIYGKTIPEKSEEEPKKTEPVVTAPEPMSPSDYLVKKAGEEAMKTGMSPAEHAEFMGGVKQGIDEELLKLNEEQLDALKKLISLQQSEEDAFEKKKDEKNAVIDAKKAEKKEELKPKEDGKSLIESALDLAKNKMGRLGNIAKGAARFLGPAAAVGAAGFAGYQAGSLLNEHVLQPGMEKLTGVKGETVGTATYTAVDKMKGLFGMETDDEKIKKAESAAQLKLAQDKLAQGQNLSPDLAKKVSALGMTVPSDRIGTPSATPYRANQMSALKDKTDAATATKTEAKQEQAAPIVVNNSNSKTTIMNQRPDVRIKEPSFNRALRMNYA